MLELSKVEKKRVRLTVGVRPEEGREKKKPVKKKEEEPSNNVEGYSRYHTCDGTWLRWMREKWI